MGPGSWVTGLGFRVSGHWFRVPGRGSRVSGPGSRVAGLRICKQLPSYRTRNATLPLSEPLPTTTGHYTICCKNLSLTLLKMGERVPETY